MGRATQRRSSTGATRQAGSGGCGDGRKDDQGERQMERQRRRDGSQRRHARRRGFGHAPAQPRRGGAGTGRRPARSASALVICQVEIHSHGPLVSLLSPRTSSRRPPGSPAWWRVARRFGVEPTICAMARVTHGSKTTRATSSGTGTMAPRVMAEAWPRPARPQGRGAVPARVAWASRASFQSAQSQLPSTNHRIGTANSIDRTTPVQQAPGSQATRLTRTVALLKAVKEPCW